MDNTKSLTEQIKEVYDKFISEVDRLRVEYKKEIEAILKEIEEDKLKNIREKIEKI